MGPLGDYVDDCEINVYTGLLECKSHVELPENVLKYIQSIMSMENNCLCTNCKLYILNCRTLGDIVVQANGTCTTGYTIASLNMKERVKLFNVTPLNGLSDHSLIKIILTLLKCIGGEDEETKFCHPPIKRVWNSNSKETFLNSRKTIKIQKIQHILTHQKVKIHYVTK